MSRFPAANYRPVRNYHPNGVREHRGLVLHVQAGNGSPFGWFNNPVSQASSDFWISKAGVCEQYVNTGVDYAWAQAAGNPYYASVETEGYPGEALTDSQVNVLASLYAWGHKEFGWPFIVVESTVQHGFTWHGVGGAAWGGHTACPGTLRRDARAEVLTRAQRIVGPRTSVSLAHVQQASATDPSAPQGHVSWKTDVLILERALYAEGLLTLTYVDGSYGSKTLTAYREWQIKCGYSGGNADGHPGRASLVSLGKRHGFIVN